MTGVSLVDPSNDMATVTLDGPLEEIFQKLEKESERRARAEELDTFDHHPTSTDAPIPGPSTLSSDATGCSSSRPGRDKKRGSVSISVFGQISELSVDNASNGSGTPLSPLATAATKSTLYHLLVNPESVDTLIVEHSNNLEDDGDHQVTRMQTIAGRPSSISLTMDKVGSLLSLTSTRKMRSRAPTIPAPPGDSMVIGVSVEEKQSSVEWEAESDDAAIAGAGAAPERATTAYAEAIPPLRNRRSWMGIRLASSKTGSRAKYFTVLLFRRKRKPELGTPAADAVVAS